MPIISKSHWFSSVLSGKYFVLVSSTTLLSLNPKVQFLLGVSTLESNHFKSGDYLLFSSWENKSDSASANTAIDNGPKHSSSLSFPIQWLSRDLTTSLF